MSNGNDYERTTRNMLGYCFLPLGFLHSVRGEFTDDVSETAVGPILTGHEQQ
jgi:hypothetical protein